MSTFSNALLNFFTVPRFSTSKEYQERFVTFLFCLLLALDVLFYIFYASTAIECSFPNPRNPDLPQVRRDALLNMTEYLSIEYVNLRCAQVRVQPDLVAAWRNRSHYSLARHMLAPACCCAQEIKSRFWRYSLTGALYLVGNTLAIQYSYYFVSLLQRVIVRVLKFESKPPPEVLRRFDREIADISTQFQYFKVLFIVVLVGVMGYETIVLFRDPVRAFVSSQIALARAVPSPSRQHSDGEA